MMVGVLLGRFYSRRSGYRRGVFRGVVLVTVVVEGG